MLLTLLLATSTLQLRVTDTTPRVVEVRLGGEVRITSPTEGLWSVATDFEDDWPTAWVHASPEKVETFGEWTSERWTVLTGAMQIGDGKLELRDSYREERDRIRGVRRFTWRGPGVLERCALSVRWTVPDASHAQHLLPGILYHGNPSGGRHPERVPIHRGEPGEMSLFEEHRFPMPFVSLEYSGLGAALHTLPSSLRGGRYADQWWSLGLETQEKDTELLALSGPVVLNGKRNAVKALQRETRDYPGPWVTMRPGDVIEKTFFLQVYPVERKGSGFRVPTRTSIELFEPFALDGLPTAEEIVREKLRFADTRWRDLPGGPGFEMYPDHVKGTHYVMGWCGQAASAGYSHLVLRDMNVFQLNPKNREDRKEDQATRAARALDLLSRAPVGEDGFPVRYDAENGTWSAPDPVSQGQAMDSFSLAIEVTREGGSATRWESFLRRACEAHAKRILGEDWRPVSTNEAFLISPLFRAARLFEEERFREAALHATEHYAARHLDMSEPYWGGTLDASCEDKEGAWAAFQAFLAAYDDSGDPEHLRWAEHAMDVFLTYTCVWDIEMPPGRLRDHGFRSHGWTAVSVQNMHLDVYGVVATPAVYRMGQLLDREDLKKLAVVMYRSCGQLIDAFGSQGEQIQQTNYAQHGDMSDVFRLRGGYSEGWTVFWITAHFLHAAATFQQMGVDLDGAASGPDSFWGIPAPLYRDPWYDGAADPVLVWNRWRGVWWMLYTQRRAMADLPGVEWCHGTEIGIAESRDHGRTWRYVHKLPLQPLDNPYTFWAPDIVEQDGVYHLFVSYVPGVPSDWSGDRYILHYTSRDLDTWSYGERIELGSDRCIDPTLFRFPDGRWRMWYKDEGHGSKTLAVESTDLETWTPIEDPGVSELYGEAPKVFRFGEAYWMLKDPDSGLDVYRSDDLSEWEYQAKILDQPGRRVDDRTIGKHADVVVCGERAFIFYFTHPDGQDFPLRDGVMPYAARRSSIQAAELFVRDGKLKCNRDASRGPIRLTPPGS